MLAFNSVKYASGGRKSVIPFSTTLCPVEESKPAETATRILYSRRNAGLSSSFKGSRSLALWIRRQPRRLQCGGRGCRFGRGEESLAVDHTFDCMILCETPSRRSLRAMMLPELLPTRSTAFFGDRIYIIPGGCMCGDNGTRYLEFPDTKGQYLL